MEFRERVFAHDYGTEIYLHGDGELLELTTDTGDEETTVVLDAYHLHELILTLQRYERLAKR